MHTRCVLNWTGHIIESLTFAPQPLLAYGAFCPAVNFGWLYGWWCRGSGSNVVVFHLDRFDFVFFCEMSWNPKIPNYRLSVMCALHFKRASFIVSDHSIALPRSNRRLKAALKAEVIFNVLHEHPRSAHVDSGGMTWYDYYGKVSFNSHPLVVW